MRRNPMRLLLTGVVISLVTSSLLVEAQQQISNTQVAAMVDALKQAAPQTKSPNDGLYSEWKVKPQTLKGWSRFCLKKELTPTQFEKDPTTARKIVSCITRRELNQQFVITKNEIASVRGVACWWMTGNYTGCNDGFTAGYVQKVVGFYRQHSKPSAK